ncbi:MAG TPA: regulator of amino acid metabolism, contains ACT domain protein [Methanomassiliicoccales archaeon]|nr:regulator of amino acid metabolism, contains ACT domain protein [Methanomassiliicoccales archaeon]
MWKSLAKHFGRYPSQAKVAKLLLEHGLRVDEGRVFCGDIEVADMAIGRAAGVDRRIVRSAVMTIEESNELRTVFSKLVPIALLTEVAPVMGWTSLEIVPTDAQTPGIIAEVTGVIAREGISVRQAVVSDPVLSSDPRLFVITEGVVPPELIPQIRACKGVRSIIIH